MATTDGSTHNGTTRGGGDARGRRLAAGLAALAIGVSALAACSGGSPTPPAANGTVPVTSATTTPLSTSRPAPSAPASTSPRTTAQPTPSATLRPTPSATSRPATQQPHGGQIDSATGIYANCTTRSVEPAKIELACADKKSGLKNLRWTSWTSQKATAVGTLYYSACVPSCAAAQPFHTILNAQVTLLDPVLDPRRHRVWSKITVHPQIPGYDTGHFHGGPEPLPTQPN